MAGIILRKKERKTQGAGAFAVAVVPAVVAAGAKRFFLASAASRSFPRW